MRFVIALVLTAVVLGWLIKRVAGTDAFVAAVRSARPEWIAFSFAAAAVAFLLTVLRWLIVLRAMGCRLSFARAFDATLGTWPLAVVTPSRANDLLRPFVVRDAIPLLSGMGSVLAERVADVLVLLVLACMGLMANSLWVWGGLLIAATCGSVIVLLVALKHRDWLLRVGFLRKRAEKIDQLVHAFEALLRSPRQLVYLFLAALVVRLLTFVVIQALLISVGAGVTFVQTVLNWPLAVLVGLAPITMAGMGTRDAAFIYLMRDVAGANVSDAALLVATVGYSIVLVWSFAILGIPSMVRIIVKRRPGG